MDKKYISTEVQTIFTANASNTFVLEIWIDSKPEDLYNIDVVGANLNIWCGKLQNGETNFMMKDAIICAPSDNDNADIVHKILMKPGDEVTAYFSKNNLLRYEFCTLVEWEAKEKKKVEDAIYGIK